MPSVQPRGPITERRPQTNWQQTDTGLMRSLVPQRCTRERPFHSRALARVAFLILMDEISVQRETGRRRRAGNDKLDTHFNEPQLILRRGRVSGGYVFVPRLCD